MTNTGELPDILLELPALTEDGAETALEQLQAELGYDFANPRLLRVALTLSSWTNERRNSGWPDNACLEFFGDAVLDLCAADAIWRKFPKAAEGVLTRLRASIVSRDALSHAARSMDLGRWLYIGRGDEHRGGRTRASTLADAVEAIIGATYLDARSVGRDPASAAMVAFVRFLGPRVSRLVVDDGLDPKSRLQQLVQARWRRTPVYVAVVSAQLETKRVRVEVELLDGTRVDLGEGSGESLRAAERAAAQDALEKCRFE